MAKYVSYAVYDPSTGRVERSGGCQIDDLPLQASEGGTVVEVESLVDDEREYLPRGIRHDRPVMPLAVNRTALAVGELLRIEGIPTGTRVIHPGGELVVEDGYLEWSSLTAGTFAFKFTYFPYREAVINAQVSAL